MTNQPTTPNTTHPPAGPSPKPDTMREADTANGENPDPEQPPEHPTGERQARENRENDPPA